jgi:hypothetical protein
LIPSGSSSDETLLNADLVENIEKLIGQIINKRYNVKKILGAGAFGHVFLVNDEHENNQE